MHFIYYILKRFLITLNIIAYGNPKDVLTRELIKEVYEVDSIINKDEEGNILSISYKSLI